MPTLPTSPTLEQYYAVIQRVANNRTVFHAERAPSVDIYDGRGSGHRASFRPTRVRNDWSNVDLIERFSVCREVAEENWFATWALEVKEAFFGAGAKMSSAFTRWARNHSLEDYDWLGVQRDVWNEFVIEDSAVALWRVNEGETLPGINIMDAETVTEVGGFASGEVRIKFARCQVSDDEARLYSANMVECLRSGREWESAKDKDYDFAILSTARRGKTRRSPAMLTILDDLEYLDMLRLGDFNAAKMRKDVIRHTKRGYAVNQGPMAGSALHHLTPKQKDIVLQGYKKLQGNNNVVTNFDIGIDYVLMPSEHFSDGPSLAAMRRLLNWGGFSTLLLQEGLSRVHGVSPYLTQVLRTEAWRKRTLVAEFVAEIFSRPSFLGEFADSAPLPGVMAPLWSNRVLYSTAELVELVNMLHTSGMAAPSWIREELLGLDNAEQNKLMRAAHKARQGHTPPFESRQGLLPGLFPDEFGNPTNLPPSDGGDGGKPQA